MINGSYTHQSGSELDQLIVNKGFSFLNEVQDGNKHTIIMMVNGSESVNNTTITCDFGGVISENATLQVISG